MNIDKIEELTKEIRKKEKKIEKVKEQKDLLELELDELHENLSLLITKQAI